MTADNIHSISSYASAFSTLPLRGWLSAHYNLSRVVWKHSILSQVAKAVTYTENLPEKVYCTETLNIEITSVILGKMIDKNKNIWFLVQLWNLWLTVVLFEKPPRVNNETWNCTGSCRKLLTKTAHLFIIIGIANWYLTSLRCTEVAPAIGLLMRQARCQRLTFYWASLQSTWKSLNIVNLKPDTLHRHSGTYSAFTILAK